MKEGQSTTNVALFQNTQLCVSVGPILVPCHIHKMLIVVYVQSQTMDHILLALYDIYVMAFGFVGRTLINGGIQPMPVKSWWRLYWFLGSYGLHPFELSPRGWVVGSALLACVLPFTVVDDT
jgi:hypothetical protein